LQEILASRVTAQTLSAANQLQILQAFNVTRLQSSSTWSGHRCLHAIPEILRVRMKASRKYHANPLAQNSCRTVLALEAKGGSAHTFADWTLSGHGIVLVLSTGQEFWLTLAEASF
jgi:hypothetical protein